MGGGGGVQDGYLECLVLQRVDSTNKIRVSFCSQKAEVIKWKTNTYRPGFHPADFYCIKMHPEMVGKLQGKHT